MNSINTWREPSMESPREMSSGRRRNGVGGGFPMHRSDSKSSTSSDILVAPGRSSVSRQASQSGPVSPTTKVVPVLPPVSLSIRGKGLLVFKFPNGEALRKFADEKLISYGTKGHIVPKTTHVKDEINDENDDGPNHRGTYSKKYVLEHPEIQWVHRGQGRYKPVTEAKTPTSNQSEYQTRGATDPNFRKTIDSFKTTTSRRSNIPQRRRSWNANDKPDSDSILKERPSLRRLLTDAQTNTTSEQRSARMSRRAKAFPTTELERRSSRRSSRQFYKNEDEDSEDEDMARNKEETFTSEYVENHPDEKFYHTGNGWWKRGERPKDRKSAKRRESEGHALKRGKDGAWHFDRNQTIHVSQLENYPGVTFHHCGNGWYKAGDDPTGLRSGRVVGDAESGDEDEDEEDEGGEEDIDEWHDEEASVSKEYARAHPEVDWVHRGNGRYKRRSVVDGVSATPVVPSTSPQPARDMTIYTKEYVNAHPDEEFHHRGNARYMRGPPPAHWPSVRRKMQNALLAAPAPPTPEVEDSTLYSKAYVDAHPSENFHHRGQGRYARGPRPKTLSASNDGMESDADPDGLVDTDYVDAHPNETFHHRGQGRWARGMPPAGASNKVAIRGPGAKDKMEGGLDDDEDEANKPPPLTALVLRAEGPDMWPNLEWYYRGGGKWGRLTKQEYEEMQRGPSSRRMKGKGRKKSEDGPEAQLEREAAAAEAAQGGYYEGLDDNGEMGVGPPAYQKPRAKRRRMNKQRSFQTQEDGVGDKQSSQSQSQAPTPKPRMLEPEEDVLTEEDLPQLYRDGSSAPSENFEDEADRIYRTTYDPLNPPEKFVKALTKYDPQVRPLDNLLRLASNTQAALQKLQDEYLELEKITAPHARIPRKPAKGGRVPIDNQTFEDQKEATLYDYTFNPNKVGYQDPQAQKIQRDAEGRELRTRRNRSGVPAHGTLPGWNFGEDEPLGPRRTVKQPSRFDGAIEQPRKRARNSTTATGRTSKAPSMTPDRVTTPLGGPAPNGYAPARRGRLVGNVPKRIQQLRDESVGLGSVGREGSPGSAARKGRPPGSKNLHKRRDAGIKKGPRKPKAVDGSETPGPSDVEAEGEGETQTDV